MTSAQVKLEGVVHEWNERHPVGSEVLYWRGAKEGEASGQGCTRTEAMVLSGHTAVVWIEGCSGCIALSHVEVVPGVEARA